MDGDLSQEASALDAEGDKGLRFVLEELVQLADLSGGVGPQILRRIHPLFGESELHGANSFQ